MILLNSFNLSLPLHNPVLQFSLILFIILFAPLLLNKLRIPHLIGLIIAGAIIGPNGLNLMLRDSSIILFGTVGLLYIMFLAGLEIDLAEFRKNSRRSIVFGLYTFIIPMALGTLSSIYLLGFPMMSSILLASMFASHTLIAYPIVSKLGVTKNRAVNVAIGGTLITDTLALLVLAAIAGMATGEVSKAFWLQLSLSVLLFGAAIMLLFPIIGRWFFKRFDDSISQYIFVLAMVFLGAFMAEAAGIEAIIGAFLAGLALNKLIPHTSPLMNRVEFVGNALFIPFFLIGVGMLIDYQVFFKGLETIKVAGVMIVVATGSKFIAAWLTQQTFRFTADERRLIFGLSNAQAAATLAAVLVGYNIILNQADIDAGMATEPLRLLNDDVLNGTILMILVTCTIATLSAQRGAQNIALLDASDNPEGDNSDLPEKILVPVNNPDTTEELIHLALTIKSRSNKSGLYALAVLEAEQSGSTADKQARKVLNKALTTAAAADVQLRDLLRYDLNIVNGIYGTVKEHQISDIILGLHHKSGVSGNFFGYLTEGILSKCNTTTLIYKSQQPLATIRRHLVFVPPRAEREIGFPFWLIKTWNIARNTGAKIVFYADAQTLATIRDIQSRHPIPCDFVSFDDWSDFLIVARDIRPDDNMIIVMSRKERISYNPNMPRIPEYLDKYFRDTGFIIVFPAQSGTYNNESIDLTNPAAMESLLTLDDIGKTVARLFKRR
jgi:Kef-type K+ transport system membrane component KefB/nucleotide-binding universal stress UspA family protein